MSEEKWNRFVKDLEKTLRGTLSDEYCGSVKLNILTGGLAGEIEVQKKLRVSKSDR